MFVEHLCGGGKREEGDRTKERAECEKGEGLCVCDDGKSIKDMIRFPHHLHKVTDLARLR